MQGTCVSTWATGPRACRLGLPDCGERYICVQVLMWWGELTRPRRACMHPAQGVLQAGRLTPRSLAAFQASGHELVAQRIQVRARWCATLVYSRRCTLGLVSAACVLVLASGTQRSQPLRYALTFANLRAQALNIREPPPFLPITRNPWLGDEWRRW